MINSDYKDDFEPTEDVDPYDSLICKEVQDPTWSANPLKKQKETQDIWLRPDPSLLKRMREENQALKAIISVLDESHSSLIRDIS